MARRTKPPITINHKTTPPNRNPNPNKNQGGRPTLYDKDRYPYIAYQLCVNFGATIKDIAKSLGVSGFCIEEWMRVHKEFYSAVQQGRDIWDSGRVEKSYLQRALGYEYKEKSKRDTVHYDKDGNAYRDTLKTVTTKQMAPDVKCMEGWLANRQPERWRGLKTNYIEGEVKHAHLHIDMKDKIQNIPTELLDNLSSELNLGIN